MAVILRRLQLVCKLQAGFNRPPRHNLPLREALLRDLPFRRRAVRGVVELGHPGRREVPGIGPRLVLVAHDRAGEPFQRLGGGEHLHDARAALDLAVGARRYAKSYSHV